MIAHRHADFFVTSRLHRAIGPLLVCCLFGLGLAQTPSEVVIGHGGAIVADAWNPVRVVSRDASPTVFEISIDRGSLREGEIPFVYRAELPGGTGLTTFTDDVYIPAWRNLQWRLSSQDRLLTSGSLAARDADTRPIHLLVSRRPGDWRAMLPSDARVLERNGPDLPGRAAAYDGVATVLVDGTTAPPRPESLLAAAATGATVVLVGTLPASYADVAILASAAQASLGNGRVISTDAIDVREALTARSAVDEPALRGVIAENLLVEPPATIPTGTIMLLGAAYALAVLLALRFGRLPGVAAALALAAMASVAAWSALRSDQTSFRAAMTLEVGSGGIARLTTFTKVMTLPADDMTFGTPVRTLDRRPSTAAPDGASVPLERWGETILAGPPTLGTQRLEWSESSLVNRSEAPLTDVYVLGLGPQPALAAGASVAPSESEDAVLSPIYDGLLPHLPPGTAVARSGDDVLVALGAGDPL